MFCQRESSLREEVREGFTIVNKKKLLMAVILAQTCPKKMISFSCEC